MRVLQSTSQAQTWTGQVPGTQDLILNITSSELVMCLARKPESRSPSFASQAKPNSGLDEGLGFGLRLVKPKPGLEALALSNKISCVDGS
jgi:hypothetical protein